MQILLHLLLLMMLLRIWERGEMSDDDAVDDAVAVVELL